MPKKRSKRRRRTGSTRCVIAAALSHPLYRQKAVKNLRKYHRPSIKKETKHETY